jgi:hypothetical protein
VRHTCHRAKSPAARRSRCRQLRDLQILKGWARRGRRRRRWLLAFLCEKVRHGNGVRHRRDADSRAAMPLDQARRQLQSDDAGAGAGADGTTCGNPR